MEYVVLAQIMIAQGRLDEAAGLLASLLAAAKAGGRYSRVIELLCLQALTAQSGGDTPEALSTLAQALAIAEPRGLIHAFVDKGPAMARLLYEAITQEIAPEYVQRLIAAFPIDAPKPSAAPHTQTREQEWVEQLSKRELEVLQLIAEGLTNPEIGARLYLSPHTIKAHARSIYGKLGVNNRTQAVYRAQSLGLLPPS
jgi:LuxR family maltose regulon positive regulatory protein